jgi:hypothetical protein
MIRRDALYSQQTAVRPCRTQFIISSWHKGALTREFSAKTQNLSGL